MRNKLFSQFTNSLQIEISTHGAIMDADVCRRSPIHGALVCDFIEVCVCLACHTIHTGIRSRIQSHSGERSLR